MQKGEYEEKKKEPDETPGLSIKYCEVGGSGKVRREGISGDKVHPLCCNGVASCSGACRRRGERYIKANEKRNVDGLVMGENVAPRSSLKKRVKKKKK